MLVKLDPITLFGIQETGPSSFNEIENSGSEFGSKLWIKFIELVVGGGVSTNRKMYGVSWPADEHTPPQIINYFTGIASPDNLGINTLKKLEILGGNYFKYEYIGSPLEIDKGFFEAYTVALPASGFVGRDGQHLEIYPEDYDPNASVIRFEILIPVN